MDDYILGIMWSIGTLQKETNRYFIQTFDEDKVYYLEKIADLKGKTVATKERTSRGKTRTMYTIFISDADYALRLRDIGYDDPNIEIPENASDDFMAAVLELTVTKYTNKTVNKYGEYGYDLFRIISDNCDKWNTYFFDKFEIEKKKISSMNSIVFGRNDMLKIAEYMVDVEKSNKSYWENMIKTCRTLVK